jgi:pimeloyl-ACP methyl ester carboxylesterase
MNVTSTSPAPSIEGEALQCTRLPSGVALHHVQGGDGPPLVFVHGVMGDWATWAPQWPAFTARFACTSYSRRYNHPNGNTLPSPDHSALVEADDLRQLLDALHIDAAVLVASSYGAFVALALAVAQPQRVRALVAVEPAMLGYADFSPEGRAARADFERDVVAPANAAFRRGDDALGVTLMTGGIAGAAEAQGEALQRRLRSARAMRMLALSSNEFPLLPPTALAALPMPVLLVSGAETPAIHRETFRNVVAAMPQAAHAIVPGAGHAVARDQPLAFNALALDFLRQRGIGQPD